MFGFIIDAKNICKTITINEILTKKFTNLILFNPAVHKIINSFSFSNFKIASTNDIKNERIEIYDEFLPILLKQHENKTYKTFPTFNSAVDEFFSKSEAQKAAKRHNMIEAAAKSKLVKMKKEQEDRIQSLKVQEISSIEKFHLSKQHSILIGSLYLIGEYKKEYKWKHFLWLSQME